jgi:glycosyltransferase involved in cell wall biosynthesis
VIVASDGSTDGTDAAVDSFRDSGVRLVRIQESQGKEFAQKAAVESTQAEVIFFTDAKTSLAPDALNNSLKYFEDPKVGALSSIDRIISSDGEQSGEGFYVRYEMWLRKLESAFCTLIGLSGSGFAVRREVCEPWRTDVPSDFACLLRARELGYRGVLGEDVVCSYGAVKTERQEFNRKVRTVLRGITTFFARREVLNPMKDPWFTFEIVSHKLCRWLVPWWMILAAICTLYGAASSCFLQLVLFAGIVFLLLAAIGYGSETRRNDPWFKVPLFFIVTNAGVFVAWIKYLSGQRTVQWNPSVR